MTINEVCSADGKYRYRLEVKISEKSGICLFLMLNPGTEEGHEDRSHPTREKCKGFAQEWGYGTLVDCNLFASRSSKPANLEVDPDNDEHILAAAQSADVIICAWGNGGRRQGRSSQVIKMLIDAGHRKKMFRLGSLTQEGFPRHPLGRGKHRLPLNTPREPFTDDELRRLQGL